MSIVDDISGHLIKAIIVIKYKPYIKPQGVCQIHQSYTSLYAIHSYVLCSYYNII